MANNIYIALKEYTRSKISIMLPYIFTLALKVSFG